MTTRYKICICLLCYIAALSCTKKLNTNLVDPNGVGINELTGKDVFAQALAGTATDNIGFTINPPPAAATQNYDFATQWMGYWARTTSFAASGVQTQYETFTLNNSFADGAWQSLYHNISDYNFVIAHSTASSILPGAARVMRSMMFQDLVDQFGNIPYTQACQPGVTIFPAYDSALSIYRDLIRQLDTAIVKLAASQSTPDDASDIMFKGSKSLWIAFANTIKLRILLRQVPNGDQNYVATEIANITQQGGGFLPAGQDASVNPGYQDAQQKQNPFWTCYGFQPNGGAPAQNYDYYIANSVMVNFLDSTEDPRLGYFYAKDPNGGYGGNFFGNSIAPVANLSSIGTGILQSPSMNALLFSAAQSFFMQSEVVQRGLMTGDYHALFRQGVEESFRYLRVTDAIAAADSFVNNSTNGMVNIAFSANPLQTILYQKWVAECELDGFEAYSDYRRTGFPFIAVPSYAVPGQPMPKRLLYPESEYTQNAVNVDAQNQQQSDIYTKLFWGR